MDLLTNGCKLAQINCLNKLIKHLFMNVPRFIYMIDLISIFRKAGVFKHRQLTKCPNEWDSEEALGAAGQNMPQKRLYTSPKESGQYTFLI